MSDLETQKRPSMFERKDVKQTVFLWVIFTAIIGYVAATLQANTMGQRLFI